MSDYSEGHARSGLDAETPPIDTFSYHGDPTANLTIEVHEFTSICPKTGLPDYGKIKIEYRPRRRCLELKSLKYYFLAYRTLGVFYEHGVSKITDDLFEAAEPAFLDVTAEFSVRGGISSSIHIHRHGKIVNDER